MSTFADLFGQVAPKVILCGGRVFEIIQVVGQPLSEGFRGEEFVHHSDDGGSLSVGDPVKDLTDLIRVLDWDGDWMRALKCIDPKDILQSHDEES